MNKSAYIFRICNTGYFTMNLIHPCTKSHVTVSLSEMFLRGEFLNVNTEYLHVDIVGFANSKSGLRIKIVPEILLKSNSNDSVR